MMDLAKVADLALIMIDASIGFEMETFEFISLLNVTYLFTLISFLESRLSQCYGHTHSY